MTVQKFDTNRVHIFEVWIGSQAVEDIGLLIRQA